MAFFAKLVALVLLHTLIFMICIAILPISILLLLLEILNKDRYLDFLLWRDFRIYLNILMEDK